MDTAQFTRFAPTGALSVEESIALAASADAVWRIVGSFADIEWHPAVKRCEVIEGIAGDAGTIRQVTTTAGAILIEELLWQDDDRHVQVWRLEESPLPITNYVTELEVVPEGPHCRATWRGRFDSNDEGTDGDALAVVTDLYRAGLAALNERFGSP